MAKKQKMTDMIKEGVSVQEIENFARKYTSEVFTALAIVVASISSMFDFFMGPAWSIGFCGLGAVIAIIFPVQLEVAMKKLYSFIGKQEKATEIIVGIVRLVIAIFIPFIIFAGIGLHAGTTYHLYSRSAGGKKHEKKDEGEEL